MNDILASAIQSCIDGDVSFSKFITANDTGATGGHQSGFHIHKNSWSLFFNTPGTKGENKDVFVKIKWQNDIETDSRFIYYGVGTRNEYRLTRFGKGFPYLRDENVGDLLVIAKRDDKYYEAFLLSTDDDIEEFFNAFGITSTDTNGLLPDTSVQSFENELIKFFEDYIKNLTVEFPPTSEIATAARNIFYQAYKRSTLSVLREPDKEIISWLATEFDLFRFLENDRYSHLIKKPFPSVDDLITVANKILNRRKSRAGKSLEHHLSETFNIWKLEYDSQPVTEANKKPDFIFPNIDVYFNEPVGSNKLIFLGAKTTCKDRWRQIIGEADRIPNKHLFTLQQGISGNQLEEMKLSGITLVVPSPYLSSFPSEHRKDIWTFSKFLNYTKDVQYK